MVSDGGGFWVKRETQPGGTKLTVGWVGPKPPPLIVYGSVSAALQVDRGVQETCEIVT